MSTPNATDLLQQTLLGDALESSQHAIFVSQENRGPVVAVSDAACRLLGYTRDELLAAPAGSFSVRTDDEVAAIYEAIRLDGIVAATARLRRKDGSVVEIDYWGSRTRVGELEFVLTVTAPIDTAQPVAT